MAANVSATQMDGLYKEQYAGGIVTLAPELAKLYKDIGALSEAERVGKTWNQPVVLQMEQGYTYAGSDGDAFAINTPIAMLMDNASLEGSEGLLASRISYRAASKAVASGKAFKRTMSVVFESHMRTHAMRRELEILYGRSPTGLATTSAGNADSGTQETLTITPASWAVGIWAGQEGAQLNAFRIDTGALISSAADAVFTLTSVDSDNKKLTLTGTSTGCTALHAQAAQLYLDFAGVRATMTTTHKAFEGLDYAITLAAGNTLWGISTNYTLWRGNSHSCASGKLTLGKVLAGVNKAVAKAGLDVPVKLYVNPDSWADLADSFSASRMLDSSYSSGEGKNGVEKVVYYGANGMIEVVIHPCVKGGEAWALPVPVLKKVGSTDITMNTPGKSGEEIFLQLPSNAGFEFRTYSDFALFVGEPAKCVKFTSIVNG
jgi:hypothetical protein